MFESFVHPGLAFGAALASVPLIIHLLNRQRHKPLQWAAMRFVLAAYRKTRRQVQLENLLLLLLRMAAVALLAFAVARPFASGESPLAALTEERRDLVLVLDGSASTGYREDIETTFERIVERARELVRGLSPEGDRARVILAARSPRLLSWTQPAKALSVLGSLGEPLDEPLDLAASLAEVREAAEQDAAGTGRSSLEVRLLTDLQARSFELGLDEQLESEAPPAGATDAEESAPAPGSRAALVQELDALESLGVRVLVEDLGPGDARPPNLGVVDVSPTTRISGAGVPFEVSVRVANWGSSMAAGARIALSVDGVRQPTQRIDIEGGGQAEAIFDVRINDPGPHTLVAKLEGDKLGVDDERASIVRVPPPVQILVVNGEQSARLVDDEVGLLMAVLEPLEGDEFARGGRFSPFEPREVELDALSDPDLELGAFDVILLANVARLSDHVAQRLEETVAGGASLFIALGGRVDLNDWNAKLFRADGAGLLPAELGERVSIADPRRNYYRIGDFDPEHPALTFFADDLWRPLLTEVPIHSFVSCRPLEVARTAATLDDEAASPLFVQREYDRGQVVLYTSTLDRDWSRIADSGRTFLPLIHGWMRALGSGRLRVRNVAPGDPLTLETSSFPRGAEIVFPDGARRQLEGEALALSSGRWRLPDVPSDETRRRGVYTIEFDNLPAEPFAVRIAPAEGDLARLAPAELRGIHQALVPVGTEEGDADASSQGPSGEIWRLLATLCLLALVCESLWSAWLGQKRRVA